MNWKILSSEYLYKETWFTIRKDICETPDGKIIDKWGADRNFSPTEGIVIINPNERIQYDQPLPTRQMKPGESYNIQANVVGYPEYTSSTTVVPAP